MKYYSTRGNYWHGVSGEATITIITHEKIVLNKSGEIWINARSESQNKAIVTGEPKTTWFSMSISQGIYNLNIEVGFLIVPSDSFTTKWEGLDVIAINLTETLKYLDVNFLGNETSYSYLSDTVGSPSYTRSVYTFVEDIGLPIEIRRELVESAGFGASIKQTTLIDKLQSYSIENAKFVLKTREVKADNIVIVLTALIALPILILKKKK